MSGSILSRKYVKIGFPTAQTPEFSAGLKTSPEICVCYRLFTKQDLQTLTLASRTLLHIACSIFYNPDERCNP